MNKWGLDNFTLHLTLQLAQGLPFSGDLPNPQSPVLGSRRPCLPWGLVGRACWRTPLCFYSPGCKGLSAGLDPRLPMETNSAFCPQPRSLQHVPRVPKPALQGLWDPSVSSLAKVHPSCVPCIRVGVFTEGAVSRPLFQEPSKGQAAWQPGYGVMYVGGMSLFDLCYC